MKKSYKRLICIIISLFILLSALPLTVHAETTVKNVGTAEELTAACTAINENGGEYTINLTADITGGGISITNKNAVVTVVGNGHTINAHSQYVYVENGATVNLGDGNSELIIQSDDKIYDDPGLVYVLNGSYCNMYDKVTLKDFKGDNHLGGGVTVEGGTFHMYGGTIKNCGIVSGSVCYGGGVAVYVGGSFIMDGGVITECYTESSYINTTDGKEISSCGGGVFVSAISSFTMNGGTISKNTATNTGGGIACGGGVALIISNNEMYDFAMGNPQSSVTINNGTITGNSADLGGGVFASGYYKAYVSALGTATPSGGAPQNPGLYINGGEISANIAGEGGGIFAMCICPWARGNNGKGAKTQIHNATIKNNNADNGAGIESYSYWTQMDIDGCTITDNTADSSGGGIALLGNSSSGFTNLKNTTITGNTSGTKGAGVYYDEESKLQIQGAITVQNNTVGEKKNNLHFLGTDYPVYVTGSLSGSQIGISDAKLWDDGKEDTAVDAESSARLTDGFKANNASLIPADAFTSDHETWVVDFGEKKTEQGAETGRTYTYTADKYITDPAMTEGYPIAEGAYIRVKALTFTGKPENTTDIYNELIARYNAEYELKTDLGTNAYGDEHIYYDSRSDKYITLYKYGNSMVYIWVGSLNDVLSCNFNTCDNVLISGVSYHQYGKDGELVIGVYRQRYPGTEPNILSESGVTLEYDEDLDFEGEDTYEDYYLNDLGIISSKYIIDKNSRVVDIQYETITTDYTNEVRLVRKKVNYHINNADIAANYTGSDDSDPDIFTDEVEEAIGKDVKVGKTIDSFYLIPEATPTKQDSCPYIFKGWYYDQDNNNDAHPVRFGTDKYMNDIYAHWIKVNSVAKDAEDDNILPGDETEYGGFDLAGVQVREGIRDTNYDGRRKPGGLRFVTSLNTNVVNAINDIKPNNIEYGYVAATHEGWIEYHKEGNRKLLYVSDSDTPPNGIDTASDKAENDNYFGFANNINCTSKKSNTQGIVKEDHRNFGDYLLYTLVITYENCEEADLAKNVLARPYIRYTDANNLERVAYSEYRGTSVLGGCSTNYNAVKEHQGG